MSDAPLPPAAGRVALGFIVATVLVDSIGFGIVIPVLPRLIVELNGGTVSGAARIGGWLAFAYAVMQFGCGPLIGNLSDRFGRRPVLIACLTAFGIDYAVMGFAPTLELLFAGRVVAGITGATYSPAYAYIADVSPPEKRAANFGLVSVAFGVGFILGPALGGLVAEFGTRVPFFVAAGLAFANAIVGLFFLPESLAPENRRAFDLSRANPMGAVAALRRLHGSVLIMAVALFVWQVAHQALQSVWSFYAVYRYHWTPGMIGASLAAVGVVSAITGGWLIRVIVPRIGERNAVLLGYASTIASYLVYGISPWGWMIFVGIAVGALQGLAYPSLNALMSSEVAPDAQGELQGALASIGSLATIVGPIMMTQVFAAFSGPGAIAELPGAPFLLAAVLATLSLLLFLRARPPAVAAAPAAAT